MPTTALPKPSPRRRAMTLIELMVSLALGVILIGIMVFVWTTSQQIMTRTTDKIFIYQNLRNVLDIMERDIANVTRTTDMEFFVDKPTNDPTARNGHYDLAPSPDNEEFSPLRPADLFFHDTTGVGSDGNLPDPGGDLNQVPYFFAPTLFSPTSYNYATQASYAKLRDQNLDPPDYTATTSPRSHRRDEFYFRSFAVVEGESRPVLIHYRLRIPDDFPERPTLLRSLLWVDRTGANPAVRRRADELAEGVTDLEFEMYYKESRIFDHGQFLDALDASNNIAGLDNQFNAKACSLIYAGTGIVERTRENGIWMRPERVDLQFGAVRPGDRIYLFGANDDDADSANTALEASFGERFLTIESIVALQPPSSGLGSTQSKIFLRFVEPIDFSRLAGPNGLAGESTTTVTEFGDANFERTIFASFRVNYRVGFLPGAFRVAFKYRDFRERRLVPFSRVVRVLGS